MIVGTTPVKVGQHQAPNKNPKSHNDLGFFTLGACDIRTREDGSAYESYFPAGQCEAPLCGWGKASIAQEMAAGRGSA